MINGRACSTQVGRGFGFLQARPAQVTPAQQSVHLTLGSLRKSQAVFYTFSFFWLDSFAVPTPAQVTQTVSQLLQGIGFTKEGSDGM